MERKFSTRLSKSKLKNFETCPHKFYLAIEHPGEDRAVPAMIRGSNIHNMFENIYKRDVSDESKLIENFKTMKIRHHETGEELDSCKIYPDEIRMFLEWSKSRGFIVPESYEEKLVEKERMDCVAIIDRVDFDGKTRTLLDYKTGQMHPISEYKFELLFYAIVYQIIKRKPVHYVGIYFVDHGKEVLMKVETKDIQDTLTKYYEMKDQIRDYENQGIFPYKPGFYCKWCNYSHLCGSPYKRC